MAAMDQPAVDLREPAGWRRTKNRIATWLMVLAFVVVLIPLGFVLYHGHRQGRLDHQLVAS